MTTITVSKEMLGRTLEALESCDAGDWSTGHVIPASYNERAVEDAINDLRAALSAPATAPEQMPSERNCVCDSYVHLDGYSGGAAKEGLYGALWVVAEGVRKKYVLAPEQSRGTAQEQPSWQDAPTVPGIWLSDRGYENPYRWGIYKVVDPDHEKGMTLEDERWFGPIQPDSGDKP